MSFVSKSIAVAALSIFLLSSTLWAQPYPPDRSFFRLQTQQQQYKGLTQYMLFHNTTATNLPYHQHYIYDPFGNSAETFTALQATARYYLNRRTFAQVTLPYHLKKRLTADTLNMHQTGMGDILAGGGYQVYNSQLFMPHAPLQHLFIIQAFAGLPTGAYSRFNAINEVEPHSMPGMGSFHFIFGAEYWLWFRRFSLLAAGNYQLNRENKYTYQYGNTATANLTLYYRQPIAKTIAIMPHAGVMWQMQNQDYMNQIPTPEYTKARWWHAQTGFTLQTARWQLNFAWTQPLKARLTGPQPELKHQWQVGLQYNLPPLLPKQRVFPAAEPYKTF